MALGSHEQPDQVARGVGLRQFAKGSALCIQPRGQTLLDTGFDGRQRAQWRGVVPVRPRQHRRPRLAIHELASGGRLLRHIDCRADVQPHLQRPIERTFRFSHSPRASSLLEYGRMHDLVQYARAAAAPGVETASGQDEVQRLLQPDQPRQALRASAGRDEPQTDFRLSDGDARRVGGDPVVARQRELHASAKGRSVDGGDGRAGQPGQLVAHRLKAAAGGFDVMRRGGLADDLQVGAGDPLVGLATRDHQAFETFDAACVADRRPRSSINSRLSALIESSGRSMTIVPMPSASGA